MIDVDTQQIVSEHDGIHLWTIGQGVALPGQPKAYYVCGKDLQANILYVVCFIYISVVLFSRYICIYV